MAETFVFDKSIRHPYDDFKSYMGDKAVVASHLMFSLGRLSIHGVGCAMKRL